MSDVTRETGQAFQRGVKSAERWEFGPFSAFRLEFAAGNKSYGAQILILGYSFQVCVMETP